jgi:glycosyltransferase involved in cell wall biosynthesis
VSIIIPAYNEAEAIGNVVRSLQPLAGIREIIVVDDGSSDETAANAEAAGARVIRHRYNRGYGASLKTGIRAARAYYVLFVDADGQHTPDDVRKVIAKLGQADMVVGRRRGTEGSPWYRRPGKIIVGRLVNHLARIRIPDINSGSAAGAGR